MPSTSSSDASNAPDTPGTARTWLPLPEEDWSPFRNLDPEIPNPDYPNLDLPVVKRMMREYLGSVASVDRNLGRLMEALDRLNVASSTIVVFTSDNGFNLGHNGIWHKGNGRWVLANNRGDRPNLYDNSLRVPAAIRWPGVIRPGMTLTETISNLDWYPTLLSLADVPEPKGGWVRGRSFAPLLRGNRIAWDNDLYAEYSMRHSTAADLRMYRTPQWKLVRDFRKAGADELYHLAEDPAESDNRINAPDPGARQARRALETKLLAKMRELHDPLLK